MPETRKSREDHLVAPTDTYRNARAIKKANFLTQGSPQDINNLGINLTQTDSISPLSDFCMGGQLEWKSQTDPPLPQDTNYTRQEEEESTLANFGL